MLLNLKLDLSFHLRVFDFVKITPTLIFIKKTVPSSIPNCHACFLLFPETRNEMPCAEELGLLKHYHINLKSVPCSTVTKKRK